MVDKFSVIPMMPYTSGELHVGHFRNYTISSVQALYEQQFKHKDVLHPIQWDCFGLPTENASKLHGETCETWTNTCVKKMTKILFKVIPNITTSFPELAKTCDNQYIMVEQKLFLDLYEKGIAYRKKSEVNWDPIDKTVLANEQVIDGKGWRSGAVVEKKILEQWFLKTSDYAVRLLDGLDELEGFWSEAVINMQRKWIGTKDNILLNDWCISRQRFWGCPIPMIHCEKCGIVPNVELPIKLPEEKKGNPIPNLLTDMEWRKTTCTKCGGQALRDPDTLDTFFDSSFYYIYIINRDFFMDKTCEGINKWLPIDNYIGGIEHGILHLLYARFMYLALKDCGYQLKGDHPFKKVTAIGMVNHPTYSYEYKDIKYYVKPQDVYKLFDPLNNKENKLACCWHETQTSGNGGIGLDVQVTKGKSEKMSKSKKNTVNIEDIIKDYSVDALRLFVLSDKPIDRNIEWNITGLKAFDKYVKKLDIIATNVCSFFDVNGGIRSITNKMGVLDNILIAEQDKLSAQRQEILLDVKVMKYNTAIAKLRTYTDKSFLNTTKIDYKTLENKGIKLTYINFNALINLWVIFIPYTYIKWYEYIRCELLFR